MGRNVEIDVIARDRASRTFNEVGDSSDRAGGKLGKFGKAASAGAAAAGVALLAFGVSSVKAYSESQEAQAKLDDAFARFPKLAGTNVEALREYNAELGRKTRFDDDATASGQAQLAAFGVTGDQLRELTPLLQDYAAKTGKDLPTAATDFGKAIQGQGRALKAVGLNLKDTGSETGNYANLVDGLRTQVGGFAEKEGKTFAGQLDIVKNQVGELQESVGAKLVPVLSKFLGWVLDKGLPALEKLGDWLGPKLGAASAFLQDKLAGLTGTFGKGSQAANDVRGVIEALKVVFDRLAPVIGFVIGLMIEQQIRVWKALAWVFSNIVMPGVKALVSYAVLAFEKLLDVGAKAARALGMDGLADKLEGAAESVRRFRDDVNNALNGIKDQWVNVNVRTVSQGSTGYQTKVSTMVNGSLRGGRASGGPIYPGMWLVGEEGPEIIDMRNGSGYVHNNRQTRAMGASAGGPGDTINIYLQALRPDADTGRIILESIATWRARGGPVPAGALT